MTSQNLHGSKSWRFFLKKVKNTKNGFLVKSEGIEIRNQVDEIINQNGIDFSNLYKSLIKIKPNDPDINYNLGIQKLNSSKALEAIPHFKIAFDANPENNNYFFSYFQ